MDLRCEYCDTRIFPNDRWCVACGAKPPKELPKPSKFYARELDIFSSSVFGSSGVFDGKVPIDTDEVMTGWHVGTGGASVIRLPDPGRTWLEEFIDIFTEFLKLLLGKKE